MKIIFIIFILLFVSFKPGFTDTKDLPIIDNCNIIGQIRDMNYLYAVHDCDWDGEPDYFCIYSYSKKEEKIKTIQCEGNYKMKQKERPY